MVKPQNKTQWTPNISWIFPTYHKSPEFIGDLKHQMVGYIYICISHYVPILLDHTTFFLFAKIPNYTNIPKINQYIPIIYFTIPVILYNPIGPIRSTAPSSCSSSVARVDCPHSGRSRRAERPPCPAKGGQLGGCHGEISLILAEISMNFPFIIVINHGISHQITHYT